MIILLIAIIIAIFLIILKNTNSFEKKVCVSFFVLNICLILFYRVLFLQYMTNLIWINILINFIFLIISLKLKSNKKLAILLIIVYFICMIFIPVYKIEDHKHVYINENIEKNNIANENNNINITNTTIIDNMISNAEKHIDLKNEIIEDYIDYYNCYGMRLKRIYLTD